MGLVCEAEPLPLPEPFEIAVPEPLPLVVPEPDPCVLRTTLETERDLRIVQVALLIGLVALFAYYAIPLGRNLKGIIYGYGLFVVTSVVNLTLRDYLGDSLQHWAQYIQTVCYLLVLWVWCRTLWAYAPVPEPELEPTIEVDYQSLVRTTREKLSSARAQLLRGMRP